MIALERTSWLGSFLAISSSGGIVPQSVEGQRAHFGIFIFEVLAKHGPIIGRIVLSLDDAGQELDFFFLGQLLILFHVIPPPKTILPQIAKK